MIDNPTLTTIAIIISIVGGVLAVIGFYNKITESQTKKIKEHIDSRLDDPQVGLNAKIDRIKGDICKDIKGVNDRIDKVEKKVDDHDAWSRIAYKEKSDDIASLKTDVAVQEQRVAELQKKSDVHSTEIAKIQDR